MGLLFVFASLFYSESFEVECPKFHIIKIHVIRNLFRSQSKGLGALVALRMVTKMAFNFMPKCIKFVMRHIFIHKQDAKGVSLYKL